MKTRLHEMSHSPYCIPVARILEAYGVPFERVPVPPWDRRQVARLTDGGAGAPSVGSPSLTGMTTVHELSRAQARRIAVRAQLLAEPRPSGGAAGVLPDLPAMLEEYYRVRGWDADGTPGAERLAALNVLP